MGKRITVVGMVAVALALVAALAPVTAQANEQMPAKVYQQAMRGLLADVTAWNDELNVQLNALQAKPEAACGADYYELVRRGEWLAADLEGTARGGPQVLVAPGVEAAQALRRVAEGAGYAALDCDGGNLATVLDEVEAGRAGYGAHIGPVRVFAIGLKYR